MNRRLRILAIGYATSTHVANRVRCFAERGHDVYILTETPAGIPGVTELVPSTPVGQDVWVAAIARRAGRLAGRDLTPTSDMARLMLDYRRLIKRANPDVVHVHYAYNTWAWMAAAIGLRPLVVSIMGGDVLFEEQGSPTPRGIALTKGLLRAADLITAKSNFLIGVLDKLGGYGSKAIRVVWGVDPAVFKPADGGKLKVELGIPADARVVLSPRIFSSFYNIHVLVEAMGHVVKREPKAHLVLTGYGADPVYEAQIRGQIAARGLERQVTFVGRIRHEKMPQYYAISDVSVGIPESDGLPQTLLEGMACGVPSIVGPLGRYSEIVRDGESAIFSAIEADAVAEAIARVLGDAELARRLAAHGREIVAREANFPQDVVRVEEAYLRLAGTGKRASVPRIGMLKDVSMYWLRR